jgi:serine/threonine protein phosphatase PrpC
MASRVTSASQPVQSTNSLGDDLPHYMEGGFSMQVVEDLHDLPPMVSKAEEAMNRKRDRAAFDHGINPDGLPTLPLKRAAKPLVLAPNTSSNTGIRPGNEDAHVIFETPYGTIFAICDGHGELLEERMRSGAPQPGLVFAQIVAKSIEEDLPGIIQANYYNIEKSFSIWAEMVHNKLPKEHRPENNAGTTALVGLFDKVSHKFYVATIGDSEGYVIRPDGNNLFAIPLSPIKNWTTPECEDLVQKIYTPAEFAAWKKLPAKQRRFPLQGGVNLVQTLGDHSKTYKGRTALSHIPDCTVLQLQEGDLILLGCDGLFDFVEINNLIRDVIKPNWNNPNVNLAQLIADYALKIGKSTDNVTVITVRVNPHTTQMELQQSSSLPTQPL